MGERLRGLIAINIRSGVVFVILIIGIVNQIWYQFFGLEQPTLIFVPGIGRIQFPVLMKMTFLDRWLSVFGFSCFLVILPAITQPTSWVNRIGGWFWTLLGLGWIFISLFLFKILF